MTAVIGDGSTGGVTVNTSAGSDTLDGFAFLAGSVVQPLVAYPNPAQGYILLDHAPNEQTSELKLVSLTGIVTKAIQVQPNVTQTRMSLTGVAPGMYKLVWTEGSSIVIKTIMVR
jgi:hypothetical protein